MSTQGNKFEPAAAQNLLALFAFQDWARIREVLGVLQKDMKAALRSSVRKAGAWANREGARQLAKQAGVPLRVLRRGLRLKFQYQSIKGYSTARLWYGLNEISLKYLGARQLKSGVRGGGETIKGAFIPGALGGHVFKRAGKSRLPIQRQSKTIAEKGNEFLAKFEGEVREKFLDYFFAALDVASGRNIGESQAIAGNIRVAP
jgi:hypothetical protein